MSSFLTLEDSFEGFLEDLLTSFLSDMTSEVEKRPKNIFAAVQEDDPKGEILLRKLQEKAGEMGLSLRNLRSPPVDGKEHTYGKWRVSRGYGEGDEYCNLYLVFPSLCPMWIHLNNYWYEQSMEQMAGWCTENAMKSEE